MWITVPLVGEREPAFVFLNKASRQSHDGGWIIGLTISASGGLLCRTPFNTVG